MLHQQPRHQLAFVGWPKKTKKLAFVGTRDTQTLLIGYEDLQYSLTYLLYKVQYMNELLN